MFRDQQQDQPDQTNNDDNIEPNHNFNDDGIAQRMVGNIKIPKYLNNVFDTTATHLLSLGCNSVGKLVTYLITFKKIHFGNPDEVRFFHIALVAGGMVKVLKERQITAKKTPYQRGATENEMMRQFCLRHEVAIP